ncbi:MAG: hypothetical protein KDB60_15590 [Propionibacteriaceae bacterium]|nr:hypothetical protein [Propionibacteriaceae bacterium]
MTTPKPIRWQPPRPCSGQDHARWVKTLVDWCLSRTPESLERRDGGYWYVLGAERAAAANRLPRQIYDDISATAEHYAPTDAALVDMFEAGLRRIGHRFDRSTGTVQLTNPIADLRIPTIPMIHLFNTADLYYNPDADSDDDGYGWPDEEDWDDDDDLDEDRIVDCDWRIEDEFSPASLLSLYTGTIHGDAREPDPAAPPVQPQPSPPAGVQVGEVGQTLTASGMVITAGRLPANRWNAKARALLILDCGSWRAKTVTTAGWAYKVRTGQHLDLTGTVSGHATSRGIPLTILTRPRPEAPDPSPEQPAEAWERLDPAPQKARPYPGRPTHWPRRRAGRRNRTRKDNRS